MTLAAGILFLAPDVGAGKTALFLKRGSGSDYPGAWCFPGGRFEDGEDAATAALREAEEETGWIGEAGQLRTWTRSQTSPEDPVVDHVDFTTFIVDVKEQFTPLLGPANSPEHTGYVWAPLQEPPQPLHPGCSVALERIGMDELAIAQAIADGRLTSPQRYENVTLFDMRITSTGRSFRPQLKEHVFRPPDEYLNDEFLARCNGLIVIFEHPEKRGTINAKEFEDRAVGSIMLPYIKGDEVWGIAKIYDDDVIAMIEDPDGRLRSTSPGVKIDPATSTKVKLEDGSKILFESKPTLLDHLALCEAGVWDKGGAPAGIVVADRIQSTASVKAGDTMSARADDISTGVYTTMADEKEGKEEGGREDVRRDAGNIDMLLEKLDSIGEKVDACMGRMDAMEKDRDDAVKRDAVKRDVARRDNEEDLKEVKDRKDAEGKEEPPLEEDKPAETVADKRKDARKDAKKDSEVEERENEEREDTARKDSLRITALESSLNEARRTINDLTRLVPRQQSDDEREAFAAAQFRADSVYSAWNQRAPAPLLGETLVDYRMRLLKPHQTHSPVYKDANLLTIHDSAVLAGVESAVYNDSMAAARSPDTIGAGNLRARTKVDATGRTITEFDGSPGAWMGRFGGIRRRAKLRQPNNRAAFN